MEKFYTVDNGSILSILTAQIDMGVNVFINKDMLEVKEEIVSDTSQTIFNSVLLTKPEKDAYDIALQATDIPSLERLFRDFNGCNLKKTASNFVAFQGKVNSEILIVDGTPESEEDKEGLPFVGEKGKLFDNMLKAIDLSREDVFIANSIPWRPPGNRYPTSEEINICKPFVLNLISLLSPKIILCMGEVVTNQILDLNESIINSRGKWYLFKNHSDYNFKKSSNKQFVLPTFNLSYLLKRLEAKKQAWEDMKMLRNKIKETINT